MKDSGGVGLLLQSGDEDFVLPLRQAVEALRPWIGETLILGIRPQQISDAGTVRHTAHNAYVRKFKIE